MPVLDNNTKLVIGVSAVIALVVVGLILYFLVIKPSKSTSTPSVSLPTTPTTTTVSTPQATSTTASTTKATTTPATATTPATTTVTTTIPPPPTASTSTPPTTVTTTIPTATFSVVHPGMLASSSAVCPGNKYLVGTDGSQYCIVQRAQAASVCNSIPSCKGYSITSNAGWNAQFPNAAQLVNTNTMSSNNDWTTYLNV